MKLQRRLGVILTVLGLLFAFAPVTALANGGDTCPEDGKVEAVGDELNDIVLDAGTEVCIKGGTKRVTVTADGVSTLQELLDNRNENNVLRSVSHYTVIELPPTTTTTVPEETTTTISETTTTVPETTTTVAETTTTVGETTTTVAETTTTVGETTTTAPEDPEEPELPFTGPEDGFGLFGLGLALLVSGSCLLFRSRKIEDSIEFGLD